MQLTDNISAVYLVIQVFKIRVHSQSQTLSELYNLK